ncbi:hypothetical protein Pyn_28959 [Prunus yedoensis var. nudiflora]|uniref:Uncharacterized protein n=1 Tax=Prunus yedoensis var. nudiflora TaxID=2094558 RepID=A0A315AMK6_PRUYE|nr:hypothetical protein Pyn_28959 [Prunus yedoensis var. nudiflora]
MMPSQKYGRSLPFAKVVGRILAKLVERFLLQKWPGTSKKLGQALFKYVGRPLLLQKLGRGGFSPCVPGRPPRNTWTSKVGPRELKFGGRYFRRS